MMGLKSNESSCLKNLPFPRTSAASATICSATQRSCFFMHRVMERAWAGFLRITKLGGFQSTSGMVIKELQMLLNPP